MQCYDFWLFLATFLSIKSPSWPIQIWPDPPKDDFASWTKYGDLLIYVRVFPCAPVTVIHGVYKNRINVHVEGRPGSNHTRNCLLWYFANALRLPMEKLSIIEGHNSTYKTIQVERNNIRYGQLYSKIVQKLWYPTSINYTTTTKPTTTTVFYYYDDDDDFDYDEEYYKELEKEEELARKRGEKLSEDSYYYEDTKTKRKRRRRRR